MTTHGCCAPVRAENAGPFTLTFGGMCQHQASDEALVTTGLPNEGLSAAPHATSPDRALVLDHPLGLAVRVSLPCPVLRSGHHGPDCYAGRPYAPLMHREVIAA